LGDNFTPVSVHRIQNKFLMRKFLAECQNLIAQRGADGLGERTLFHGTRSHVPHEIIQGREGFMTDCASEGLYGTAGCAGPPAAAQPAVQLPKIVRFYPEAETH